MRTALDVNSRVGINSELSKSCLVGSLLWRNSSGFGGAVPSGGAVSYRHQISHHHRFYCTTEGVDKLPRSRVGSRIARKSAAATSISEETIQCRLSMEDLKPIRST